jgi:hypothetical protein
VLRRFLVERGINEADALERLLEELVSNNHGANEVHGSGLYSQGGTSRLTGRAVPEYDTQHVLAQV